MQKSDSENSRWTSQRRVVRFNSPHQAISEAAELSQQSKILEVDEETLHKEAIILGEVLPALLKETHYLGVNEVDVVNAEKPFSYTGNLVDCIFMVIRDTQNNRALTVHVFGNHFAEKENGRTIMKKLYFASGSHDPQSQRIHFFVGKDFNIARLEQLIQAASEIGIPRQNIDEVIQDKKGNISSAKYDYNLDAFVPNDLDKEIEDSLIEESIFSRKKLRGDEDYILAPAATTIKTQ
jgi:hypothetical protein